MVCTLNKRTEHDRWKVNGSVRVNLGRQLSDEMQGCLVLFPGALPFTEQTCGIEDIGLRRYARLPSMIALPLAAVYFVALWLGWEMKLGILLHDALNAAKRLFVIPDF
jgi:hypothetical protein